MAQRRSGLSSTLCLALTVMAAMCAAPTAQQQPPVPPAVPVPVPGVPLPPTVPVPVPGVPLPPAMPVPVPGVPLPPAVPVPVSGVPVPSVPMPAAMPVPVSGVPVPSVPMPAAVPVPSMPVPPTVPAVPSVTVPPAVPVPSAPSCPPVQASLKPCVSYFIGNSSSPSDECCSQMKDMYQSQAPCLCTAMAVVPSMLGSALGQVLPNACNLPPNACSAVTGTSSSAPAGGSTTPTDAAAAAAPVADPAGMNPATPASGAGVKKNPDMVYSAAVAADRNGISAALVLAMGASFLAARVL